MFLWYCCLRQVGFFLNYHFIRTQSIFLKKKLQTSNSTQKLNRRTGISQRQHTISNHNKFACPSVCLSVCLSVTLLATSRRNYRSDLYEKIPRDAYVSICLNFGIDSPLYSDVGIFRRILQHCEIGRFFHSSTHISGNSDRVFMKILS